MKTETDAYESKGGGATARRRPRPAADLVFDYKDVDLLRRFLTEEGKIVPARMSRLNRKQQSNLTTEVKRARQLALLPFAGSLYTE
jgi:ribosomal protein S18